MGEEGKVTLSSYIPGGFNLKGGLRAAQGVVSAAGSVLGSVPAHVAKLTSANGSSGGDRERVLWAAFDVVELPDDHPRHHGVYGAGAASPSPRRVLLLAYASGFQVWDVSDITAVHEVVSRREGPIRCLRPLPNPASPDPDGSPIRGARPVLAVVGVNQPRDEVGTSGARRARSATLATPATPAGPGTGGAEGKGGAAHEQTPAEELITCVRFYSMESHTYVHTLEFPSPVLHLYCSTRLVAVALEAQIYAFDAGTLQNTFSVLTYPIPAPMPPPGAAGGAPPLGGMQMLAGAGNCPMALGARWLAYAANQAVQVSGIRTSALATPSPGASPSTSPATGAGAALLAHYGKESAKSLAQGVFSLGGKGYSALSGYVGQYFNAEDGGVAGGAPLTEAQREKASAERAAAERAAAERAAHEAEVAGTVLVRDVTTRAVVAHFRAHTSPLSVIAFDPSGMLLVTCSVRGHSINVFRLCPPSATGALGPGGVGNGAGQGGAGPAGVGGYQHLYKLHRGVSNAVIQDIAFSCNSRWLTVCTTRGTAHVYGINPHGGPVTPATHCWEVGRLTGGGGGGGGGVGGGGPGAGGAGAAGYAASDAVGPPPLRLTPPPLAVSPALVKLSVLGRVKLGHGWRGAVSDAAAAAASLGGVAMSGAGAAQFRITDPLRAVEGRGMGDSLAPWAGDELHVLSPEGRLTSYSIRAVAEQAPAKRAGSGRATTGPMAVAPRPPAGSGAAAGSGAGGVGENDDTLGLVMEPMERWEVCRQPSWAEREEPVWGHGGGAEGAGSGAGLGGSGGGGGALASLEALDADEEHSRHQVWMAHAEVCSHLPPRSGPLWASHQFRFRQIHAPPIAAAGGAGAGAGAWQAPEDLPSKPVEVRRAGLVPLDERLDSRAALYPTTPPLAAQVPPPAAVAVAVAVSPPAGSPPPPCAPAPLVVPPAAAAGGGKAEAAEVGESSAGEGGVDDDPWGATSEGAGGGGASAAAGEGGEGARTHSRTPRSSAGSGDGGEGEAGQGARTHSRTPRSSAGSGASHPSPSPSPARSSDPPTPPARGRGLTRRDEFGSILAPGSPVSISGPPSPAPSAGSSRLLSPGPDDFSLGPARGSKAGPRARRAAGAPLLGAGGAGATRRRAGRPASPPEDPAERRRSASDEWEAAWS